jgi:hypothetical protein
MGKGLGPCRYAAAMTPDAVKSIGGVCQLAGVVLVVRDLVSIHEYKGDVARLRASVGRTLKGFGEALRKALMGGLQAIRGDPPSTSPWSRSCPFAFGNGVSARHRDRRSAP